MSTNEPEPQAADQPAPKPAGPWRRLSRRAKIAVIAVAVIVGFGVIGALGDDSSSDPPPAAAAAGDETTTAATDDADNAIPDPDPLPVVRPEPPQPKAMSGIGSRVLDLRLRRDSPLVVTGRHTGSSNFIVELVPRAGGYDELVFNEIGGYSGQKLVAEAATGRYRVKVQADGNWSLQFSQPVPNGSGRVVPGKITGRGSQVVRLRSGEDLQALVSATHRGESNFIVHLVGYGDTTGQEMLYNEIGVYTGETLVDIPSGEFLLSVVADGTWSIRFAR